MPSPVQSILRAATRTRNGKLNILTFPTHERYESNLCRTGHNFYSVISQGHTKPYWDTDYAEVPENYTIIQNPSLIPMDIDFDLVLSQNKFGQFELAREIANRYNCPLVSLEHTIPPDPNQIASVEGDTAIKYQMPQQKLQEFYEKRGHINLFISEYNRMAWGWGDDEADVIHHGINTDDFAVYIPSRERDDCLLSVVNDWQNRDWCCGFNLWKSLTGFPETTVPVKVMGSNPGLSEPAETLYDLIMGYNKCRIFLNTSLASPIPTTVLEAMSCGCAVVSTATCMIPEIIENGVNGYCSNDPQELREYIDRLRNDVDLCDKLGRAARETILTKFSLETFIQNWNNMLFRAETIGEKMS